VARLGLVRSFQISAAFPHLTALENVRVALQRQHGHSFDFWRSKTVLDRFNNRARELLDDVGLSEFAKTPAVERPYGHKRALEIATTLALDPEMMPLDEPMAGMGHEDIDKIAALIKRISRKYTILMVEHDLSVVANLSDIIIVLTRGRVLAEGNLANFRRFWTWPRGNVCCADTRRDRRATSVCLFGICNEKRQMVTNSMVPSLLRFGGRSTAPKTHLFWRRNANYEDLIE